MYGILLELLVWVYLDGDSMWQRQHATSNTTDPSVQEKKIRRGEEGVGEGKKDRIEEKRRVEEDRISGEYW